MKKIVYTLLLITLASMLLSLPLAQASQTEDEISALAAQHDKVVKASCVVHERNCIVALQTKKFTSREEYLQYTEQLKSAVTEKYEIDNVFITRNPRVMRAIDKLSELDDNKKQEMLQRLLDDELRHREPHPPINDLLGE